MSKMGQWVFEMQEDAYEMTEEEFVKKHGKSNREVWQVMNGPDYDDPTGFDPEDYYYET